MRIIDLRSDTVTQPSPEMRKAMYDAEVGDDVLGEDPTIKELQETVARLLNKEAALFVPSGTMGNQLALKTHTQPGNQVICEEDCHILHYEAGAGGMLSGIQLRTVRGHRGIFRAPQVEELMGPPDIHHAPTTLITVENTHNRAGGTIYPLEVVEGIHNVGRAHGIALHLDGARLMNACTATGIPADRYARYFDSVSIALSKGLGAPVGSVLAGSGEFIAKAKYYRKAFGGAMRQVGILGAAGLYALRYNVARLAEDHEKARRLALAIRELRTFLIDLDAVQTNIVIFEVAREELTAYQVVEQLQTFGIQAIPFGRKKIRFVTHLDVSMADIDEAISCLRKHYN